MTAARRSDPHGSVCSERCTAGESEGSGPSDVARYTGALVGVDTDAEVARLRDLLRDLVALSAIPAVWVERAATVREPGTEAVAAGLADALVRLLQLDFAFVRLCDPGGDGAAHATRGDAWKRFPHWLGAGARLTRQERIADVGDGPRPCPGVAIPIGVRGEAGLVAAACERADFPTATDQLLLSLAANQAATAFQSARLVDERGKAEQELREARNALEVTVAERTAELRRSEAYLAEAQRLTHTGSFAIDAATRAVTHSSDEHSRLYGFDPQPGTPSIADVPRAHPSPGPGEVPGTRSSGRSSRRRTIEMEFRVVLPSSAVRHHRGLVHPVVGASGEVGEILGTIVDITERREAEAELERLAGEQAALRRVATLVAREASQADVFTAIAEGIGQLFGSEESRMLRYEDDRTAVVVACSGELNGIFPIGARQPLGGDNACSRVFRTGRPARIEDYGKASGPIAEAGRSLGLRCVVATPILVEGRLWGAMVAGTSRDERLAAGDGIPPRPVHRADGDRDRQHRVARQGEPALRRPGRAATGGDAGGARRAAGRHLHRRQRRGRPPVQHRPGGGRALRRRRPGDRRRGRGAGPRRVRDRIALGARRRDGLGAGLSHGSLRPRRRGRLVGGQPADRRCRASPRRRLDGGVPDRRAGPSLGRDHRLRRRAAAVRRRRAPGEVHRPRGHRARQRRRPRGGGAARRGAGRAATRRHAGRARLLPHRGVRRGGRRDGRAAGRRRGHTRPLRARRRDHGGRPPRAGRVAAAARHARQITRARPCRRRCGAPGDPHAESITRARRAPSPRSPRPLR